MRASLLVLLAATRLAQGNERRPSPDEIAREMARDHVRSLLSTCSDAATLSATFGLVEVVVPVEEERVGLPGIRATYGLREADVKCIRDVFATATIENVPSTLWVAVPIGAPRSIVDPRAIAMWKRSVLDPTQRPELTRLLPTFLTLTREGCLRFRAPSALLRGIHAWLYDIAGTAVDVIPLDIYSLGDDWWIRVHSDESNYDGYTSDEVMCLDHVEPPVSALRSATRAVWNGAAHGSGDRFEVEWVIDDSGAAVGVFGFCTYDNQYRASDAELRAGRAHVEKALRAIDYGRGKGLRRITMKYADGDPIIRVSAAAKPLAPGDSTIEQHCRISDPPRVDRDE